MVAARMEKFYKMSQTAIRMKVYNNTNTNNNNNSTSYTSLQYAITNMIHKNKI